MGTVLLLKQQMRGEKWTLTLYVDSGYGMDPDKRHSRYDYIIFLNGNPISFGTGLAKRTATSTSEAEYVAMAHGLKELLWTYQTLLTIGVNIQLPMHIMEDNQACIIIADNPISQRRTRHVDIRFHFIRDYNNDGTVTVKYCPTKEILTDILTKIMHKPTFQRLRSKIISDVFEYLKPDLLLSLSYCQAMYNSLLQ